MSKQDFFPYSFASGALTLDCEIAGVETDRTPSGAFLFLDELAPEAVVSINLRVEVAPGTLERVLPPEELDDPPCQIAVVLRSAPGRQRTLVPLDHDGDGFHGKIQFKRSDLHQDLVGAPVLFRTFRTDGAAGFGSHPGALLADGDPVQILLEEPPAPPGGHLDIEFENFAESADPLRRTSTDALLALDIHGDFPKLWLNSGVTNLVEIMNTRARRGANARIRDAMFQSITAQVWTSLIFTSVESLASSIRDGIDSRAALDEMLEWQKRVLYFWAPRIYHWLGDRDQALDELCAAAGSSEGLTQLHETAIPAIQRQSSAKAGFEGLIRLVTREGV